MKDIISWVNESRNRKLISLLLILFGVLGIGRGISYLSSGAVPLYNLQTVPDSSVPFVILFIAEFILTFTTGVIFLILGILLWRSAK